MCWGRLTEGDTVVYIRMWKYGRRAEKSGRGRKVLSAVSVNGASGGVEIDALAQYSGCFSRGGGMSARRWWNTSTVTS